MMCFDKPIGAIALGAALIFGGAAFAQAPGSPYFYRLEHARGVYYIPGTPVLSADPVMRAAPGTPAGPPPLAMDSTSRPTEPLMTGRSVAIGMIGNHCDTPAKTCLLYHSAIQGGPCSCKVVPGGHSHGTVAP